ncbi:hypothetical protein EYF80_011927 [Liparis tanakae]|uniref:Uncharacterized protein n=1 Tax=Liparis tanakae TaxID=230148 RepID=A0A4Z2IIM9_9TELE|nr:hypothetical protein EYF80_011927 [Liparis tanakae]
MPPVLLLVRTESADAVGGWLDIRGCRRSWTSYGLNLVTDFCWKKSLMMFVALLSELRAESLSRQRSPALIQFILIGQPYELTEGGGHDFSLLPRRLHWSSDSEQLSDLQTEAALLGLSQLLQFSDGTRCFYGDRSLLLPGTCVDSAISRMSLTYSLAKAEKIGSSPHNIEAGSSAGSIVFGCMSW